MLTCIIQLYHIRAAMASLIGAEFEPGSYFMSDLPVCPGCGGKLPAGSTSCPQCQRPIGSDVPGLPAGRKNPWAFSLAELFIGTTYICLLLAVTLAAPEWGAVLWGVSAFALARTIWFSVAWKRAGKPLTPMAQIGSFAESLVVMGLVAAAASVAFVGVCVPLGASVTLCCGPNYSDSLFWCAWVYGGLAGLGSGGYLLWWLWIWPIVQWWRQGEVPTLLVRLAALARTVVVLSSTFLGSATLAIGAGWAWAQSIAEGKREERLARIALYWMLLVGFAAGCVLGIVAGRWVTRARKRWFWPILAAAALALIALGLVTAFRVPPFSEEDSSPVLAGILVAYIIGIVIHRIFARAGLDDGDSTKGRK